MTDKMSVAVMELLKAVKLVAVTGLLMVVMKEMC